MYRYGWKYWKKRRPRRLPARPLKVAQALVLARSLWTPSRGRKLVL
jgi:hypothetical protein